MAQNAHAFQLHCMDCLGVAYPKTHRDRQNQLDAYRYGRYSLGIGENDMTHAQKLRDIADRVYTGVIGTFADSEAIRAIASELDALDAIITPDIDPVRDHPEHHMKWTAIEIKWIKAYAQKAVADALNARVPMTEKQVVDAWDAEPGLHSSFTSFEAGIRAAESHHKITGKE